MSRRFLLPLLLAAVAALSAAQPAAAQSQQPGFAVDAVGFDSYFKYRSAPGAAERGAIRVRNITPEPVTILLHAADVTSAATGGLDYGGERPRGEGRWLELDRRRVRLAGGQATTVGFRLRVPAGATPGDHLAGIVAMNEADERAAGRRVGGGNGGGLGLRFLPRLAIAVQSTLPGGDARELTPGRPSVEVTPSVVNARLPLRHTGDRLVTETTGDLALMQGTTVLRRTKVALDAIVPGTEVALRVPFTGTPAQGTYRVVGTLLPKGGKPLTLDRDLTFGDQEATEFRQETGRDALGGGTSPVLVALVAVVVALLVAALVTLLRRQRRLAAELARRPAH